MAKYLNIVAHQVQIPIEEKDVSNIFDLKFGKVLSLIQQNLKTTKTERTMILAKQDRFLFWMLGDLDGKGGYRGTAFKEQFMDMHHSVMGYSIQEFQDRTHPFAACHIKVFKTDCVAPAEHYILFDLPEQASDTRFILKLIEKKAITRNILVHVDIITTNREKSDELAAIVVEMKKRLFEVPEFLGESIIQQLARQEEQEAARLREERKRHRSPSPQTVYDVKPDANGIYHYPAKFLCKALRRGVREDEVSSSEDEDNAEVCDPDYNSEDEYLPPWMLH